MEEAKNLSIPKLGRPPGESRSYQLICIVNTMGKILQRIIYKRLMTYAEAGGALSDLQYLIHLTDKGEKEYVVTADNMEHYVRCSPTSAIAKLD